MTITSTGGVKVPPGSGGKINSNSPPEFTTPEGSLGSILEPDTMTSGEFSTVATDANTGDTITYSIFAGALPISHAYGTMSFSGQPNNDDTIILNGVTWTFKTSGATGEEVNISATTIDTISNLVTALNLSVNGSISSATYTIPTAAVAQLGITFSNSGGAGNSYTISVGTDVAGVQSVSGATLTGGNVSSELNSSTGAITGGAIQLIEGTTFDFTVEANDGFGFNRRNFSIQVDDGDDLFWRTLAGTLGQVFLGGESVVLQTVAIDVSGEPIQSYSKITGDLPTGLLLNESTGEITGTAVAGSTSTFTLQSTDTLNNSSERSFTIRVNAPPAFSTSGNIGSVLEGGTDSFQVTASTGTDGLTQIISYEVLPVLDGLPTGYSLNTATGAITGIAGSVAGNTTFNFTIRASDGLETTNEDHAITITNNVGPIFTTPTGVLGQNMADQVTFVYIAGESVSETVVATDLVEPGPQAIAYTIAPAGGSLPSGLSLNGSTGEITGTAQNDTTATFTLRASDSVDFADRSFTIQVNGKPIWETAIDSIGSVQEGESDSFQVTANAGDSVDLSQTVTYAVVVNAAGLTAIGYSLNGASGAITGTATDPSGPTAFTVRASDGLETEDRGFSITVVNNQAPTWDTASGTFAAVADEGVADSTYTVVATDPDGAPNPPLAITYSLASGSLPAGMSLAGATGIISGTPTDGAFASDETVAFTLFANDSIDNSLARAFAINVNCATFENATSGNSDTGRARRDATALGNLLNLIYGVGTGTSGYGQTPVTVIANNNAQEMPDADLLAWRTAVSVCASHQGITLDPVLPLTSLITGAKPWSAFSFFDTLSDNVTTGTVDITTNKASFAGEVFANVTAGIDQLRTTPWGQTPGVNTIIEHTFTVTFASTASGTAEDSARAFFNSGGQIKMSAARSGGLATTQNSNWTTLLSTAGQYIFDSAAYFALGATGLTSKDNTTGTGAYNLNDYDVAVGTNAISSVRGSNGSVLTFRLQFSDDHVGISGGPDAVDGNLITTIEYRIADDHLSLAVPTFNTTSALTT